MAWVKETLKLGIYIVCQRVSGQWHRSVRSGSKLRNDSPVLKRGLGPISPNGLDRSTDCSGPVHALVPFYSRFIFTMSFFPLKS